MTKTINAEIIAVGTELLLGQISNTNAQWLSDKLAQYGVNVLYHGVVGDNPARVRETFAQADGRSDLIIVTGGLGPTEDDMTREAFSTLSGLSIIEHEQSLEKIEAYFKQQDTPMTPNNRRQARVFEGAQVLENSRGMAPGMIVEHRHSTWVFLPGVPKEMKHVFQSYIPSLLTSMMGGLMTIQSTVLKFAGIGESSLEDELKDFITEQQNPTIAPLSEKGGNVIRLTAKAESGKEADSLLQTTKASIIERLEDYYIGSDEDTIESVIISRLKALDLQIAAAESLTGGLFTEKLISVPGASDVCPGGIVTYNQAMKEQFVNVSSDTLTQFGAISEECALEMARGVRNALKTTLGISFTGVAGPSSVEDKPVGTVYIGISHEVGRETVHALQLEGDRDNIRQKTVLHAMTFLFNFIKYL